MLFNDHQKGGHNEQEILCSYCIYYFRGALFPPLSSVTAAQGEAVIATDEMNVRSGPGLSYGITAEAKKESAIRF